jgi:oligopeptide/dipeptide ABC transporter ATP-binding protein
LFYHGSAVPEPLVRIENLTKHFPASEGWWGSSAVVQALDDVSLEVHAGETLGVVGESGSGKSTLGRCSLALIQPTAGRVLFEGRDLGGMNAGQLRRERRHMQMIFQDPVASLNPRMRIADVLAEPFQIHERLPRRELKERSRALLRLVGLGDDMLARYPHEFSGGQRQRIGVARALALQPRYIVADEPVSALDVSVGAQIVNLLQDLQEQFSLTYLFISHSLPVVKHIARRVAVMYLGKVVELGPTAELLHGPLHPYTVLLLASIPDPVRAGDRSFKTAPGELPSAVRPPLGCRFRTRCPMARERCAEEPPALRQVAPGHFSACHFAEEVGSHQSSVISGR